MKTINGMRAKLLHSTFPTDACDMVISSIYQKMLQNLPSYVETHKCSKCDVSTEVPFFTICPNNHSFNNDVSKLEMSIALNFPQRAYCKSCKIPSNIAGRCIKSHLFIEVRDET